MDNRLDDLLARGATIQCATRVNGDLAGKILRGRGGDDDQLARLQVEPGAVPDRAEAPLENALSMPGINGLDRAPALLTGFPKRGARISCPRCRRSSLIAALLTCRGAAGTLEASLPRWVLRIVSPLAWGVEASHG